MARYSEFWALSVSTWACILLGAGCILYYGYNSQRVYIMALDSFLGKIVLDLPGPFVRCTEGLRRITDQPRLSV